MGDSTLNLVRALNLSVRLRSTGLALRKVVCTSVHAAIFSVFFVLFENG